MKAGKWDFAVGTAMVAAIFAAVLMVVPPAKADGVARNSGKVAAEPPTSKATGLPGTFYVGGGAAQAISMTDFGIASISSDGFLGKAFGGYDYCTNNICFGVGVAYWLGTTNSGVLGLRPNLELFARAGYVLPTGAMLFAGAQYKRAEMSIMGADFDVNGWGPRLGLSMPVLSNVDLTVYGSHTRYDTEKLIGENTKENIVGVDLSLKF